MIKVIVAFVAGLISLGASAETPVSGVTIVHVYPHDDHAYTEGLFYRDGFLYESTGQVGQSTIRKVRLADGVVLQSQAIPETMFGEGIVAWKDQIISLTWRNQTGFRWDLKSFARTGAFHYDGEGWALTEDGTDIIMSDGTPALRFLDPASLHEKFRITVTEEGRPVQRLNELEWVKGEIWANIWLTNRIARINPLSGKVIGWIDLSDLPETKGSVDRDAVLNGIAYDPAHDRLFVTGKDWPHLYEIRLNEGSVR